MNSRAPQPTEDTRSPHSDPESTAHLSENKISKLLAECLEEVRALHPGTFSGLSTPLVQDPEADGPFTTVCKLASGNTAIVYLAVDHRPGAERVVAVKHYRPAFTDGRDFPAQFARTLSLPRGVDHPSVCKLLDYGRTGTSYYTVSEFLPGEPLSNVFTAPALQSPSNRSPRLIAHLIANLAEGLHAVHTLHTVRGSAKPVHGDITTDNLFVLYDGQVRVMNFGTAWIRERSQRRTPSDKSFLSPEQLEASTFDARVDIWALGVVLWELLTGKKLFQCTTNLEAVVEIMARDIAPPSAHSAQVPPELDRITLKALARNPAERYASARELAAALRGCSERSGGAVAASEVAAWLTRLFPNGADRCRRLLERAGTVPAALPRFADSFGSAPPVSYEYAAAADDEETENTTQIYAPKVDENTLRSLEWPLESQRDPTTLRRPRPVARPTWRATFAPFGAAFAIVFLGFFAGHATFSRSRVSASPTLAPAVDLEPRRSAPVAATFALKPTADEPPSVDEVRAAPPPIESTSQPITSAPTTEAVGLVESPHAVLPEGLRPNAPARKPAIAKDSTIAHATPKSAPAASAHGPLATQPSAVYVSTPGGGDVYERGSYLGRAPGEFELSPGWHTLLLKSGDDNRAFTVQVPADSALVVSVPASKP